jgi:hypothetical protein
MAQTICVVGNAGNITDTEDGSKIDSYDNVVRFNNFQLKGFEKHTGLKTTIWATSFYNDIRDPLCGVNRVLCPLPRELMGNDGNARYAFNCDLVDKYSIITDHIPMEMFEQLLTHIEIPSTGIAFLYWMSQMKGKLNRDDIFGFSFFEGAHHYFDEIDHCKHTGDLEKEFAMEHIFK